MKRIFLIGSLLLSLVCQAQNDTVVKREKKTLCSVFIGIIYPFQDLSSEFLELAPPSSTGESWRTVRYPSSARIAKTSPTFGFSIGTRVARNTFFNTGLTYTETRFATKDGTIFYVASWGNASTQTFYDTTSNMNIKETFSFIGLPFDLSYHLRLKTSYVSFGGGYAIDLMFHSKTTEIYYLGKEKFETVYDNLQGLGLLFSLSASCGIFEIPTKNATWGLEFVVRPYFGPDLDLYMLTTCGRFVIRF